MSSPLSLICSDSFLQKARVSYTTPTPSLVMVRVSCRDLDSEDVYVQVRCDLIADADTVADQIKEREDLERKETVTVTQSPDPRRVPSVSTVQTCGFWPSPLLFRVTLHSIRFNTWELTGFLHSKDQDSYLETVIISGFADHTVFFTNA